MTYFSDNDKSANKNDILELLKNSNITYSFNSNPERFISRSLSQTRLQKFIDCPSCFFKKSKKDFENKDDLMLSNTIHYLADYLVRNKENFPNSHSVLDFINFSDGNFLEFLKTDEENQNYDILNYLVEIKDSKLKERILKSVLIVYGTAKRMAFEEVRKKDSISLNLQNTRNKTSLILYTKPDYTGRHKTISQKSGRVYDNFLIDYKLNFSTDSKSNSLQMAFYYLTHLLSNRKIHNYYVMDITSGNLYQMKKINLINLFSIINKFLILKNINFRGNNNNHNCDKDDYIFQDNFLNNLDIENFGNSFGSKTYNELLLELKSLEESLEFSDLGAIVNQEELEKVLRHYPIKIDSTPKD